MSCCCLSFQVPGALPSLSGSQCRASAFSVSSCHKSSNDPKSNKLQILRMIKKKADCFQQNSYSLAVQVGALLAIMEKPALAVTGVNDEPDIIEVLIQLGIVSFFYFLVAPPIIMNWLRVRWYKRNLSEMFVQFMFVFIFFPGLLLWAPFLNFRKFPRDPNMKYPWSTPENPSEIKSSYLKYPFAKPEDYELFE